jgi:hypothetical protein
LVVSVLCRQWAKTLTVLVLHLVGSHEDDPATQLRARPALVAILVGNSPMSLQESGAGTSSEVALEVALELASPRSGRPDAAT